MIAIIGAGPAGIALARGLDRHGIDYEIFERERVASTWRSTPSDLRVLSPWWTNILSAGSILKENPLGKVPSKRYLRHLLTLSESIEGKIHENEPVVSIFPGAQSGWEIATAKGRRETFDSVVVATGYFANPYQPDLDSDGSIPCFHAQTIRNYSQLDTFKNATDPIAVVGSRVTAGQIVLELADRGIQSVICARSPIEFRRHGPISWLREMLYFVWEELECQLRPGLHRNSYPGMEGGRNRKLVEDGTVPLRPPIQRIRNRRLEFGDSTVQAAAGVIFATGYRPALNIEGLEINLGREELPELDGFQMVSMPGVYLLGFDNIYDHRSRYLRGIRRDASRLCALLASISASSKIDSKPNRGRRTQDR